MMCRYVVAVTTGLLLLSAAPVATAGPSGDGARSAAASKKPSPGTTDEKALDNPFYRECVLKHLDKARTQAALKVLMAICRKETE